MSLPIKVAYEELDFDHSSGAVLCRWQGQPFTGMGVERYPDGTLRAQSVFQDGSKTAVNTLWDANGQLQERTVAYAAHALRTVEWFPSGNIKRRTITEYGIQTMEQTWDSEGVQITDFAISEGDAAYDALLRHQAANTPAKPATSTPTENSKARSTAPMENLGPLNILRIPLSNLWDAPNIRERIEQADTEFGPRMLRWFCRYQPENQIKMRNQLQWALQNPSYDFKNMLVDVKTVNQDILFYFEYLLNLIEHGGCPDDASVAPVADG